MREIYVDHAARTYRDVAEVLGVGKYGVIFHIFSFDHVC